MIVLSLASLRHGVNLGLVPAESPHDGPSVCPKPPGTRPDRLSQWAVGGQSAGQTRRSQGLTESFSSHDRPTTELGPRLLVA